MPGAHIVNFMNSRADTYRIFMPHGRCTVPWMRCRGQVIAMSKKKDRAWFVCPQWAALISDHYASDAEAGVALKTDPRGLVRLRSRTPVAKSTMLRILQVFSSRHDLGSPVADLVIDTRSR